MGKGMRAGKKPSGGGGGMQKQLQQMQAMQRKMEVLQAEIEEKEVTTTAGGGAVTVTVSGKKEVTGLVLKPEVVDPEAVSYTHLLGNSGFVISFKAESSALLILNFIFDLPFLYIIIH